MTPEIPNEPIEQGVSDTSPNHRFSLLSHDLRSALSDILGGLKLVDASRLDSETREQFDRISVSGEALARLLDKTLVEESFGAKHTLTQAVNINLMDLLSDIRKRWTSHARQKGIAFEIETTSSLPAIVTLDRVSLDRVIANLVGNSIKFTDQGRVVLAVECTPDKSLCFKVSDNGPGFSTEALAHLFQYEGRPSDPQKPGSGLGLYIAREMSGVLGATLDVFNKPDGTGAEAVLCLSHETWFDRSLRRDGKPPVGQSDEAVDLTGLRILVAEDNMTNQLVATLMLGAMGADYAVASDGLEALELIETEYFDLALLDIEMPRMTGLELIRAVRAMPEPRSDMPLVALTAYVMREHRERIYAAGADGIIAKPVMSIQELGHSVLTFLKQPKTTAGAYAMPDTGVDLPADEVVDRAIFDQLVETIGAESTGELLGKLQADTDTVAEGLARGQKSLDLVEIRSQTHILISVAGAIGARNLQHCAQKLNAAANRQESPDIEELCVSCLSGLAQLQGFILDEQARTEAHS